jgi:hypothetical protein
MQDEPTPDEQLRKYDVMEREAVYLMTDPDNYPPIWSEADLGRELETREPGPVLRPLINAGLIHRTTDGFGFATAAAYKMVGLVGHVA